MKISLLDGTTEFPLSTIGVRAGICWNSPTGDKEKNVARAKNCIKSGHGRVMEYVDIEFVLEDASARMMRELYTHIGGDPTRLQSSTRYVDASNFEYFTPSSILQDDKANGIYKNVMETVSDAYSELVNNGVSKEHAANVLPLGMNSKMVMKCNLRMMENLMSMRLCSRAYVEMRSFASELKRLLSEMNDEWKWIADSLFVPKCEKLKYLNKDFCFCTEDKCCGRHKKISELNVIDK